MSVEYGIITSVVPPRGWKYPQLLSSGQTIEIEGFSFEQLLDNIVHFRRRHLELCGGAAKTEIAAVRADYRDYVCKNFKQNCAGGWQTPAVQTGGIGITNYVSPINKAADWLGRIGNQKQEYVDAALAAQRAQICAQCNQNVQWLTPCGPCNENVLVRTQQAKGSLATPYDRNLMVCRIYGHHNQVAVWLKDTHSTPQSQPPAHCWRLSEQNG